MYVLGKVREVTPDNTTPTLSFIREALLSISWSSLDELLHRPHLDVAEVLLGPLQLDLDLPRCLVFRGQRLFVLRRHKGVVCARDGEPVRIEREGGWLVGVAVICLNVYKLKRRVSSES